MGPAYHEREEQGRKIAAIKADSSEPNEEQGQAALRQVTLGISRLIAQLYGEDAFDDSALDTARRVVQYWREYVPTEIDFKMTTFDTDVNQLIVVNNIEFSSICAHHLLPFWGIAHVGYIPNTKAIGLSKIPRIVNHFARRPQTQERLTRDIASFLKAELEAMGVAVVVIARHTCMACRGVRQHNGHMTTSEMRGVFLTADAARLEFLELTRSQVSM